MKTICQHNRLIDICAVCTTGMRECYTAFMAFYPWRKNELPTYESWILSDDEDARIFRQGWAARAGKCW